jgi:hypothetical protein
MVPETLRRRAWRLIVDSSVLRVFFFWGPIEDRQPGARHGHGRAWEQVSTHTPGQCGVDSRGLKTFLATWLPFLVFTNLGARDYQPECGRRLGV